MNSKNSDGKFHTGIVWCEEKPFCVGWTWNPRQWLLGMYRQDYDAIHFWAFHLGPLSFFNDFEPIDDEPAE